jgi:hypothetical protein
MVGKDISSYLKELKNYLKIEKQIGKQTGQHIPFEIKITNTALDDPNMRIVFMGVKLRVINLKDKGYPEPMWAHTGGTRKRYKLDYQLEQNLGTYHKGHIVGNFPEFPDSTDDERQHGLILFPGQAATYKFMIPVTDFERYKFEIEGNISRRHLFYLKNDV